MSTVRELRNALETFGARTFIEVSDGDRLRAAGEFSDAVNCLISEVDRLTKELEEEQKRSQSLRARLSANTRAATKQSEATERLCRDYADKVKSVIKNEERHVEKILNLQAQQDRDQASIVSMSTHCHRLTERTRAEIAAAKAEAVGPWFLLYDGASADGSGATTYVGRTLSADVVERHMMKLRKKIAPGVGYVLKITNDKSESIDP